MKYQRVILVIIALGVACVVACMVACVVYSVLRQVKPVQPVQRNVQNESAGNAVARVLQESYLNVNDSQQPQCNCYDASWFIGATPTQWTAQKYLPKPVPETCDCFDFTSHQTCDPSACPPKPFKAPGIYALEDIPFVPEENINYNEMCRPPYAGFWQILTQMADTPEEFARIGQKLDKGGDGSTMLWCIDGNPTPLVCGYNETYFGTLHYQCAQVLTLLRQHPRLKAPSFDINKS